jgi:hypothetical protein
VHHTNRERVPTQHEPDVEGIDAAVRRAEAEFLEMPGLKLTEAQGCPALELRRPHRKYCPVSVDRLALPRSNPERILLQSVVARPGPCCQVRSTSRGARNDGTELNDERGLMTRCPEPSGGSGTNNL